VYVALAHCVSSSLMIVSAVYVLLMNALLLAYTAVPEFRTTTTRNGLYAGAAILLALYMARFVLFLLMRGRVYVRKQIANAVREARAQKQAATVCRLRRGAGVVC
jgi:hypothetical protein